MKKYYKNELAKNILKTLAGGTFVIASLALPGLPIVYKMFNAESRKEKERIRRVIRRLNDKKFVKIYQKDGYDVVEITGTGKKEVLKYKIDDIKIQEQKRWDGKWRIVMFDVPEKKKRVRDALSLKLSRMGCFYLQKSVFVCPYECEKEIKFVSEYFKVPKNVIYIEANKISNEDHLKGLFNL